MDLVPVWSKADVAKHLPPRKTASHKGSYGTALLVAGSPDMPGAAMLAAKAAMRSGLGKLVVATDKESILPLAVHIPEATFEVGLPEKLQRGDSSSATYRSAAIGPGMPPDSKTENTVNFLIDLGIPLVLDAGALSPRDYSRTAAPVILTPHPAEFSRITGISVDKIQKNRAIIAAEWAAKWQVTIVLKGPGTITAFPDGKTVRNPTGNSALAKGGTGDTLTGMLLGMLCLHDNWQHAVLNAVHLHGACADEWTKTSSAHTLLAHELADLLPEVMKSYEQ
ncbi:NAD(P)H-hydrate dehydratase [Planococcus sp. CAU13]|uniref:NAD(P)H-hydrate dehydratase n=1 Tax=Planococcus sp. CAU13 TaxID=1541197 RepID=UPI00052FDFAB|nr:NAD(P)H-hydrate dehydratase [Planococcus sp. CAU13]